MPQKSVNGLNKREKICAFCFKAVALLTLIMTVIALIGSFLYINKKATGFTSENALCKPTTTLLIIVGAAALIFFWYRMFNLTEKASDKTLKIISGCLFALFAAICTVMCIFMKVTPNTDSKFIQDMALVMAENGSLDIDTTRAYFQNYSNNDLLTILISLFFRVMLKFGVDDLSQACIWLNAVCIVLGEAFAFFGVKTMWGLKSACRYLLISVMQPTIYMTVPWSYSNTMCLPFMCGLFLICAIIYKSKSMKKRCLLAALFGLVAVVGYYIRPVVMFEAIAFAVFAVLNIIVKEYSLRRIAACVTAAVIFAGCAYIGTSSFVNKHGGDNSRNYPVTHWIMMGLHDNGKFSGKDSKFTRDLITKEEKTAAHIAEIKKEISERGITGLITHGVGKICITWSDGSGNYYLRSKLVEEKNLITRITVGGGREYIMLYSQMFRTATLLLAALSMLWLLRKKHLSRTLFPLITLFGGMIFYVIWEAKESYSIPFLFIIIILAEIGLKRLKNYIKTKNEVSS